MEQAAPNLSLPASLTLSTVSSVQASFAEALNAAGAGGKLRVHCGAVMECDSAGAALFSWAFRTAARLEVELDLAEVPNQLKERLSSYKAPTLEPVGAKPYVGFYEWLGGRVEEGAEQFVRFAQLSADSLWFAAGTLARRHRLRPGVVTWEMAQMGSRALGVVGLIAFLVGATMGLQSAAQLRRFGADIFVVDLIVVSLLRELGPLMAAIVVAGRSGAAVAAELGTMVVTEEVDALNTMGLHPVRFLVVPKLFAITLVQPLLTVFANVLGVLGGFGVAVVYLDISPDAFFARMQEILQLRDVLTGLVKSVLFAWLIVLVGAHFGFSTRGGADAVGRSTTSSVVAGIFAVVVTDAIASLVFYFGG